MKTCPPVSQVLGSQGTALHLVIGLFNLRPSSTVQE